MVALTGRPVVGAVHYTTVQWGIRFEDIEAIKYKSDGKLPGTF